MAKRSSGATHSAHDQGRRTGGDAVTARGDSSDERTRPTRRRRFLSLLIPFFAIIVWAADVPGRVRSAGARLALEHNRPYVAGRWATPPAWFRRVGLARDAGGQSLIQGLALWQRNRTAAATAAFDEARLRGVADEVVRSHHDLIAAQRGDLQAIKRLTHRGTLHLSPQAILRASVLGALYHGEFDWALQLIDQWERDAAGDAAVPYYRGRVHELREQWGLAEIEYRVAAQAPKPFPAAAFRLGRVLREKREFADAIAAYRSCLDSPYADIANIEIAACHWELRENRQASQAIAPVLNLPVGGLADAYLEVEEYVDYDRAALVAARIHESDSDWEKAAELLRRVLRHNHRNFEAQGLLVSTLRRLGKEEEAREHAERHQRLLSIRRECFELRNRVAAEPEDIEARNRLARLYFQGESLAEAQLEANKVLRMDPGNADALRLLGEIRQERAGLAADSTGFVRADRESGR